MLGIRRHVPGGTLQQIGVFAEQTQRVVAPHAQQPANLACAVIVIDVQRDPRRRRAFAERTDAALGFENLVVLVERQAGLVAQVNLTELFEATVAILLPPRFESLWIRLLPCLDACDLAPAISLVPLLATACRARLAFRSLPIAPALLPVEVVERLHFPRTDCRSSLAHPTERV